jgi:hypothetical protein
LFDPLLLSRALAIERTRPVFLRPHNHQWSPRAANRWRTYDARCQPTPRARPAGESAGTHGCTETMMQAHAFKAKIRKTSDRKEHLSVSKFHKQTICLSVK